MSRLSRSTWAVGLTLCISLAQADTAAVPAHPNNSTVISSSADGGRWQNLKPAQREALAPLEKEWPGIEPARRQKWLILASRFAALTPAERLRIQGQMADWARLSPAERGQARLQFQEARQVPSSDREQRWRAYQALSPEQRQQFAARARSAASASEVGHRDAGTATRGLRLAAEGSSKKANMVPNPALSASPKPIGATILQSGPGATTTLLSRRATPPPHLQIGMPKIATAPEFVNPETLLPRLGPQAAGVRSPASSPGSK